MKLNFQYQHFSKSQASIYTITLLNSLFCLYIIFGLLDSFQAYNGYGATRNLLRLPPSIGISIFFIQLLYLRFDTRYKFVYLIAAFLSLGATANPLIYGSGQVSRILVLLSNISIVIFLLRGPLTFFVRIIAYILYGFLCTYFAYSFYIGVPPEQIFSHASRNMISLLLIVYSAIIYIIDERLGLPITPWPAAICLFLSVMSYGRSGIISSSILLIGILCLNIEQLSTLSIKSRIYRLLLILLLPFSFLLYDNFDIGDILFNIRGYFVRLETLGLLSEGRANILTNYINQLDLKTFLFGFDVRYDNIVSDYGGNYHNSFLRFHSAYGISSIIFIFLMLWSMIGLINSNKLLLLVLTVVSIRISVDLAFFSSNWDFIIYYIVSYYFTSFSGNRIYLARKMQ